MTPGERAYTAFLKSLGDSATNYVSWDLMEGFKKSAWEAAANAAIDFSETGDRK